MFKRRLVAALAVATAALGTTGGLLLTQSGTSTVQGYDAVDIGSIPSTAQAVGCYVDGPTNCSWARSRFPRAHIITITTRGGNVAKCVDAEPGDASPSQAASWVRWMLSLHEDHPCVYASIEGYMPSVKADLAASGTSRSSVLLWCAHWTETPALDPGCDAKQWHGNLHCCYDRDTFSTAFFGPPPVPNAPGCDNPSAWKSHCYQRFPAVVLRNAQRDGWCSKGCVPRNVVERFDREVLSPSAQLRADEQRLGWLAWRDGWQIRHHTLASNRANDRYGQAPNLKGRANGAEFKSWNGYTETCKARCH